VSQTSSLNESTTDLSYRVKEELKAQYARGARPTAREYLDRFWRLRADRDLAVSLIYEEFVLLEETGATVDAEEFCRRYPRWRESLELQLRIHRELRASAGYAPAARPLPEPGDCFHGFRIESILGRGGTAQVYLAYEEAMGGRPVALKVSPDHGREPEIIGWLDHPRIMPAFSVCHDPPGGLRGLCMPYRPGVPLDALVRRIRPLRGSQGASALRAVLGADEGPGQAPVPTPDWPGWLGFPSNGAYEKGVAWIILAVAQAVHYIHSLGLIHRDIKPGNVYVGVREGPLLFDFGFAKWQRAPDLVPGGTLAYMAPEQLVAFLEPRRWDEVGSASDIYSLGLTLVELLLDQPPDLPRESSSATRAARELLSMRSRPRWPARLISGRAPRALAKIATRCLAPSPRARYDDVRELAEDLVRFIGARSASRSRRARRQKCFSGRRASV